MLTDETFYGYSVRGLYAGEGMSEGPRVQGLGFRELCLQEVSLMSQTLNPKP